MFWKLFVVCFPTDGGIRFTSSPKIRAILSTLPLGDALPASWAFFAPKMAQEPDFDPNLPQICAQNWPKSYISTPTCTKVAPKSSKGWGYQRDIPLKMPIRSINILIKFYVQLERERDASLNNLGSWLEVCTTKS